MIKFATVGRGPIVECFIKGAELTGKFCLGAVYSRNRETGEEFAKKHNCGKVYTDLKDLADDPDIQAVYIASPNICHAKQSEILLKGGKHIICEKPIAVSADEYAKVKSTADSLNLIYMEAIIPRYVENHDAVLDAVGKIGNITMAKIDYCQLTSRYEKLKRGEKVNIFDMSLAAGALMDIGVYCVYAAVDLLGMPKSIKAAASFLPDGADSAGAAVFQYDNFTAAVTYSKVGQSMAPCEIIGDEGSVIIEKIGLYQGAYLLKNGEKTALFKECKKEELMGMEALALADLMNGRRMNVYKDASELCLKVHKCMDIIKREADIKYTYKEENI